jgi:topoisomerase-4 subunit A
MLIKQAERDVEKLVEFVPGPDFPTGGIIVEAANRSSRPTRPAAAAFRVRAKWETEDTGRGGYQIVVTEIPYQVQKSRLIEKIAELIDRPKLPLLDDVRDESAEDVRLVLVPKSRTVDPDVLMESLFKLCPISKPHSAQLNVLSMGKVPKVMGPGEVLQANGWRTAAKCCSGAQHRLAARSSGVWSCSTAS